MTEAHQTPALLADVGGTHVRFAQLGKDGRPFAVRCLALADFDTFEAALADYLAQSGARAITAAAIALAAPVGDGRRPVRLTNARWTIDPAALCARFGWSRVELLNDFAALAMSLPYLPATELGRVCGGQAEARGVRAVIGPGTGLGVASLVAAGRGWIAVPGEGGHVTLPATDAREAEIIALARREHPHVSAERLVSGSGLPLLHRCVCAIDGLPLAPETTSPEAIVAAALGGDAPACVATVDTFLALLGTVAGNLALTLGARGGIYLGGGILPRLATQLESSAFARRFVDKGRFAAYLADIPVYVILSMTPALIGAARALMPADDPACSAGSN